MERKFSFSVPALEEISPAVRTIAENIFKNTPLSERDQNRLKLVFSEIFMNAIKHGSDRLSPVDIFFFIADDYIGITIEDRGKENKHIDAEELKKIVSFQEQNNDLAKTSGRGLAQIAKKWTDNFEVLDSLLGGIKVSVEKFYKEQEKPAEKEVEQIPESSLIEPQAVIKVEPAKEPEINEDLPQEVFKFSGIIDETTIIQKTKRAEEFFKNYPQEPHLAIFDFNEVGFFMSTFIGKLIEWKKISTEHGGDIKIINLSEELYELLDLTGMNHLINISLKENT